MGLPRVPGHLRVLSQTMEGRFDTKTFSVIQRDSVPDFSCEVPIVRALIGREIEGDRVVVYNSTGSLKEWRKVMKRADCLLRLLERGSREPSKGVCKQNFRGRRLEPVIWSDDDELFDKVVRNASGRSFRIGRRRVGF